MRTSKEFSHNKSKRNSTISLNLTNTYAKVRSQKFRSLQENQGARKPPKGIELYDYMEKIEMVREKIERLLSEDYVEFVEFKDLDVLELEMCMGLNKENCDKKEYCSFSCEDNFATKGSL